jgi:uncharacterized protein YciI
VEKKPLYFLIIAKDKPGRESTRDDLRGVRIAWLDAHRERILAGGGMVDDHNRHVSGGLLIIEAQDRADAQRFANEDPFTGAGLYETLEIVRWRRVFFDRERITDPNTFAPD